MLAANKIQTANLDISDLQKQFGLSYHLESCQDCLEKCGFEGKRVLEVGGSLPEALVMPYLGAQSWIALEDPDYYRGQTQEAQQALRNLHSREPRRPEDLSLDDIAQGYKFVLGKVEELPAHWDGQFDLVFSIAAFEHLLCFPAALRSMASVLKPGGKLYAFASPVWSSQIGHHIPPIHFDNQVWTFNNCPIPKHGHLLMSPPELHCFLSQTMPSEPADRIVYYVYHSPHINRLFTEDYLRYFEQSPLTVEHIEFTGNANVEASRQQRLEQQHPRYSRFANTGIVAILSKPIH